MLFKAWFYACKLGLVGFALVFSSFVLGSWKEIALLTGIAILIPIAACGAVLGILAMFGLRSTCPRCGMRGEWFRYGRNELAMSCETCGVIHGNPLWDFKLRVDADDGGVEADNEP